MTISIHQPNFIPWYPYFQKIEQCDLFVILSHVQFRKGGYESRFNHNGKWHGMSVNRGLIPLVEKKYIRLEKDWKRLTTLFPKLKIFDDCVNESLVYTNMAIIMRACLTLGIITPLITDYPTLLTGTKRLVDICKAFGASKYLSGISGKNYLDLAQFEKAEIEVIFQDESTMDKRPLVELI